MKLATVGLLFIIIFIIIAGCVWNNPQNNTTNNISPIPSDIPVNPGFHVYTNNTYNFSIEYPANWTVVEGVRDEYSNSPASVTYVVTFYPPLDNRSSKYDSFMVAFDNSPLASSDPITLDKYMFYGIKHYYEELYLSRSGGGYSNVSIYPAVDASYSYYYDNAKLSGTTYFIITSQNKDPSGLNRAVICRLVYRTSADTNNNHLKTAQSMLNTFKLK